MKTWTQEAWEEIMTERARAREEAEKEQMLQEAFDFEGHDCAHFISWKCRCSCGKCGCCR